MKLQKGFAHLLILFILIIISISVLAFLAYQKGYLNKQRVQPTYLPVAGPRGSMPLNHMEYENKKYHYSFTYDYHPEIIIQLTCGINPKDFNGEEQIIITTKASMQNSKVCFPLEGIPPISIYTAKSNKASIKDFDNSLYKIKTEDVIIGGINAIKATETLKNPEDDLTGILSQSIIETRIYKDGYTYFLVSNNNEEIQSIYNQILSTFKFTNNIDTPKAEVCIKEFSDSPLRQASNSALSGIITGQVFYPSEGLPKGLLACAYSITEKARYCSKSFKDFRYKLSVPEDKYYVYLLAKAEDVNLSEDLILVGGMSKKQYDKVVYSDQNGLTVGASPPLVTVTKGSEIEVDVGDYAIRNDLLYCPDIK